MRVVKIRYYFTVILLFILQSKSILAAENNKGGSKIEKSQYVRYYVAKGDVNAYGKKSTKSYIINKLSLGETFQSKLKQGEWIYYNNHSAPVATKGWVMRSKLVTDADFTPILSCWPFKNIAIAIGDYFLEAKMDVNGKSKVIGGGVSEGVGEYFDDMIGQVFIAGKVIKIDDSVPIGDPAVILGYNKKTQKLSSPNYDLTFKLHDKTVMKGCNQIK